MTSPIVLRKSGKKIKVENTFGHHLADVTTHDTEFFDPVTEAELFAICKVVKDFGLFIENIIEE